MKKIVILLAMLIGNGILLHAEDQPILVTPQWLKEHLSDPKLVLLQPNNMKLDYDNEHIAGARYVWPEWLTPNSPEGNYNVPDLGKANAILQQLGINNDSHVVICHVHGEVSLTARIFLTLEHLGLKGQVSYVNGGLNAWKKEGYPVTKDLPVVKKGNFKAKPVNLIVDKNYVANTLKSPDGLVVDARMKRFYDGEPTGNPRDGHITGAVNIQYTDLINPINKFKSLDSLQTYFTPVIPSKEKKLVTYCFIGQTASVVYMAGRLLGYNITLYDGSIQEWSRLNDLPMEKTK